jgi:hypothetical protein
MAPLRIESNRNGWSLVVDGTSRPDYYRADLSCATRQAAVEFYRKDVPSIGELFTRLAEDWRGWEGEHAWGR